MIILYILLFIVCLSTLVMVHELGHLLTAKMFNVYCFEYAIGFGPKLFSRKRKGGETYFSLRAIPFGGFVSMYGESETVPEGLEIDPSRSLNNIAKWKKAIIMVAGIAMNFFLAIVLFIVYEGAFTKYQSRYAHVTISESSIAAEVGLKSQDFVYAQRYVDNDHTFIFYDDDTSLIYEDDSAKPVYLGLDFASLSLKDTSLVNHAIAYDKISYDHITVSATSLDITKIIAGEFTPDTDYLVKGYISAYTNSADDGYYRVLVSQNYSESSDYEHSIVLSFKLSAYPEKAFDYLTHGQEISVVGKIVKNEENQYYYLNVNEGNASFAYPDIENGNWLGKKRGELAPTKLSFHMYVNDENKLSGRGDKVYNFTNTVLTAKDGGYHLPDNLGISLQLDQYRNSFGDTFKYAFEDFAEAGTLIYRSLGSLFTDKNAWKQVGGIIAIGVTTTKTLQENGFGAFLMYWAIISVNLGIVNLLPFPGLDGWHLVVTVVEGISRKEIPNKVKNWMSVIGLFLLFGLMILILIKDMITFI